MDPYGGAVVPRAPAYGRSRRYYSTQPRARPPPPEAVQYEDDYREKESISSKIPWIILVAVLLLVIIGLAVAYGISVNKEEPPKECNAASFDSSIRLGSLPYSSALEDKTSTQYAEYAQWFCTDLSKGMKNLDECGKTSDKCQVTNYREGSVYIQYKLWVNFLKTEEEIREMAPQLKETLEEEVGDAVNTGRAGQDQGNIFKKDPSELRVDLADVEQVARCPALYIQEHARILGGLHRSNYEGESITIRCDPGFKVHDDEIDQVLTCGTNGVWDDEVSECTVNHCPDMEATDLEHRVIREPGGAAGNVFNSVVMTDCDKGYSLDLEDATVTTAAIRCMEDGTWGAVLPPCLALKCPDIEALPRNTTLESPGKMTDNVYDDEVTLICPVGMQFESEDTSKTWTCDALGQWDDDFEGCEYINGIWTTWTDWPNCKSKCSDETVNRTRKCVNPPDSESKYPLPCIEEPDVEPDIEYSDLICVPDEQCVSVFAALTTEQSDTDIIFDKRLVDKTGTAFDGTLFTAPAAAPGGPEKSIYLFSLSGGVNSVAMKLILTKEADDTEVGAIQVQVGTNALARGTTVDTVSRDVLIELGPGEQIKVEVDGVTNGDGPEYLTSISIFSVTGLMNPGGVAFTVGLTASKNPNTSPYLPFANEVPQINIGGFINSDGIWAAPKDGIYFLSMTMASDACRVDVTCDGDCFREVAAMQEVPVDFSLSRSGLFKLNTGDKILVEATTSTCTFVGSENIETSFSGFLYDPCAVDEKVAFFALNDQSFHSSIMDVNPLYFNWLFTDIGDSFDHSIMTCRIPGLYYFHFTRPVLNEEDDLTTAKSAQLWLMQNKDTVAGLKIDNYSDESVMARSIIVQVQKGDQIYIKEESTDMQDYYPGAARAFLGMLLQ